MYKSNYKYKPILENIKNLLNNSSLSEEEKIELKMELINLENTIVNTNEYNKNIKEEDVYRCYFNDEFLVEDFLNQSLEKYKDYFNAVGEIGLRSIFNRSIEKLNLDFKIIKIVLDDNVGFPSMSRLIFEVSYKKNIEIDILYKLSEINDKTMKDVILMLNKHIDNYINIILNEEASNKIKEYELKVDSIPWSYRGSLQEDVKYYNFDNPDELIKHLDEKIKNYNNSIDLKLKILEEQKI